MQSPTKFPVVLDKLRRLVLDRCTWDPSTCAELIPQLSSSIQRLQIEKLGVPEEYGDSGWGTSSLSIDRITPGVGDVLLPSFYGLARCVRHLKLSYPLGATIAALPDLSLLTGDIQTCDVDLEDAGRSDQYIHRYPPKTKKLVVKLNKLYWSLLRFVEKLQKPEYLPELEAFPEIWIKAMEPQTASAWGDPAHPPIPLVNPDPWLAGRQAAVEALSQRGLHPPSSPPHIELMVSGPLGLTSAKYTSFWAWDFTVTPAGHIGAQDDFTDHEGGVW